MAIRSTRKIFSLMLTASMLALTACSYEYHENRDAHMYIATPPQVTMPDYAAGTPHAAPMVDPGMVAAPVAGPDAAWQPVPVAVPLNASNASVPAVSGEVPVLAPNNVQMLGQPGMGPAAMNPAIESMPQPISEAQPDSQPLMDPSGQ